MIVNPDFSEMMEPNKPGMYICEIKSADLKYGQISSAPYISWKLHTYPEKRLVMHSTPLTGRGAGMFKHFVHCAGDQNYDSGRYDTDTLINKLVSMVLAVDERGYFVVKNVTPLSEQQIKDFKPLPPPEDDIKF